MTGIGKLRPKCKNDEYGCVLQYNTLSISMQVVCQQKARMRNHRCLSFFLQTTSIFTSNTSEFRVGSHRTHKKVWQKSHKFLNQEGEHENLIVAELNLRTVVNKVKFPCINKHSTGRIREGLCKDNTSKDPFSQCELYMEHAYRSKLSTWLQRQEFN